MAISKRWMLPVVLAALASVLAFYPPTPASAASASKTCTPTSTPNVYTCTFTIIPGVVTTPGSWLVQAVPGIGTISGMPTIAGATGCTGTPIATSGTTISPQFGNADYNVQVAGCSASAVVAVTETVLVSASGPLCQRAWVTAASPPTQACANVTYTPVGSTGGPSATKTCTPTSTLNRYTCLFTVTPGFPAAAGSPGDFIHVNEPPGPGMTGGATFVSAPTVGNVVGCAETPTPVVLSSATSYNADIGPSGCPGTTWSVQFIETIDVTATGTVCQSFYMVAAVPPTTACASVVYTPPVVAPAPAVAKTCQSGTVPNVYSCTLTITPGVSAAAGVSWLVQMTGPGSFSAPSTIGSATSGCGSGSALPSVTAGTLINTTLGNANYDVTMGSAGCAASAVVVVNEVVTVTADGQVCQTVWTSAASPGLTACAPVAFSKSLTPTPGGSGTPGKGGFVSPPNFGTGTAAQVVFNGGTTDQLEAAVLAGGGSGVWVQDANGAFQLLIANGPAFLKEAFAAKFPGGFSAIVGVTVVR